MEKHSEDIRDSDILAQHKTDPIRTHETINAAIRHARKIARPDGHWIGELCANPAITAEYIFLHQATQSGRLRDSDKILHWLLSEQQADGSWTIAYGHPGDVSMTVEVYLALKILGLESTHSAMVAGRHFILNCGGLEKVRMFTRVYLAMFGLWPWAAIPEMPAELILLPAWSPINIYRFSSWARSTTVPLLLVCHHRPIYPLPDGRSESVTYLDELRLDSGKKNVPYLSKIGELGQSQWLESMFVVADNILKYCDGLRWSWLTRQLARRRCLNWIIDHQEEEGDWAGIFPPMHFGILALLLEGFDLAHPRIQNALDAIERFAWRDEAGTRFQSCLSPVWDTVLMSIALCDAGAEAECRSALAWAEKKQLVGPEGDWRVYCKGQISGGWSFEYNNRWYPDVDDTAVAVIAFLKHDGNAAGSRCVIDAVAWILSMQNQDGGWAAFDKDNDKLWLNKIPFSDMDSLCDPSTADVTGRILEALGVLMDRCCFKHALEWGNLLPAIRIAADAAIRFLVRDQERDGCWYGRWGVNYIYGTSNVLCGLAYWKDDTAEIISSGVDWLCLVQNEDGGWGECLDSYRDPALAGCGTSTASQTAWALMGLLAHVAHNDAAVERGVRWLISHAKMDADGTCMWPEKEFTGTGFPNHFYIRYNLYAHYFPLMALGRYASLAKRAGKQ